MADGAGVLFSFAFFLSLVSGSLLTNAAADSPTTGPVRVSETEISEVFRQANAGNAEAQLELARRYEEGRGLKKDDSEAVNWFQKAGQQGNVAAERDLGVAYLNGRGITQDGKEGVRWIRKVAERGYAPAQCTMGILGD